MRSTYLPSAFIFFFKPCIYCHGDNSFGLVSNASFSVHRTKVTVIIVLSGVLWLNEDLETSRLEGNSKSCARPTRALGDGPCCLLSLNIFLNSVSNPCLH